LRELAATRPCWGYRRLHILLGREGMTMNHKKLYRLYREEQLFVRRRRRKRLVSQPRVPLPQPKRRTQRWSLDFMTDTLLDGRGFRTLNVVDDCTRECHCLIPRKSCAI
jgi:putative transposase